MPAPVGLEKFTVQEILWAYNSPSIIDKTTNEWVDWVYNLRQPDHRHFLEFIEGWGDLRIVIAGMAPWSPLSF